MQTSEIFDFLQFNSFETPAEPVLAPHYIRSIYIYVVLIKQFWSAEQKN